MTRPAITAVRGLTGPGWVRVLVVAGAIGLVGAVNLYLVSRSLGLIAGGAPAVDWLQYVDAARRLAQGGDLYAVEETYAFHYSPLLAWAFGPLGLLGTALWRGLHVVAALALPTWPMRLLALASWPLWYDVETGNLVIFVVLAAAWALRGSRISIGAFLVLALLVPRPLMVPVAVWLLWKHPAWRIPFVAAAIVHVALVLVTGWADAWLGAVLAASGDVGIPSNVGPSRFIGVVPWMAIGLPLAAWLTWRGRLGLASLAVSPYWLPYYLLALLLELVGRDRWPFPAKVGRPIQAAHP